jgi:predicted phage terminase large subunit-like protein
MQAGWYRSAFSGTRFGSRNATHDFNTTRKGYRFTTSVDGTLTGIGGSFFMIDDPNPASDERSAVARESTNDWYRGTLRGRLDDPRRGVIVVIQQRIHEDDLSGYLLANDAEQWVHLNLPAIAIRDELIPIGPGRFHQRRVGDVLDSDREWSWFKRFTTAPNWEQGDRYVQSWDTANKAGELNDFSVCTTWLVKGRDYYLLDLWRGRPTFPELKRQIYALAARWGTDVLLIEDKGSGTQLIAQLEEEDDPALPRPIARLPKEDKVTRMAAQTDRIEQGHVHIPLEIWWLASFRSEMLQFPKGKFDDQVDSVSQFLQWVTERPAVGSFFVTDFKGRDLLASRRW